MRKEYDFTNGVKNPYAAQPETVVTIHLDNATIDYFKGLAEQMDMPYQTLISQYLVDCATKKKKPAGAWI